MNRIIDDEYSSLSEDESHFGDIIYIDDSDIERQDPFNEYVRQQWTDENWFNFQRRCRYTWYRRTATYMIRVYGNNPLLRNRPHIIPLEGSDSTEIRFAIYNRGRNRGLFDVAILQDRVRHGIVELEIYNVISTRCHPFPIYSTGLDTALTQEQIMERRLDQRGFPRDRYTGPYLNTRAPRQGLGWYPLLSLSQICPELVMTYFLRRLPIEDPENTNWRLWTICYDMIRVQDLHPYTRTPWRHHEDTTAYEASSSSSEETLENN